MTVERKAGEETSSANLRLRDRDAAWFRDYCRRNGIMQWSLFARMRQALCSAVTPRTLAGRANGRAEQAGEADAGAGATAEPSDRPAESSVPAVGARLDTEV